MIRILALGAALFAVVPAGAMEAVGMRFDCAPRSAAAAAATPVVLAGQWDIVMDVGGVPSFGLLSVAEADRALSGSLALNAGVVVVRRLAADGDAVTMVVASGEGDVRFTGRVAADGRRLCGMVDYHGGRRFALVAQKRPERAAAQAVAASPPAA